MNEKAGQIDGIISFQFVIQLSVFTLIYTGRWYVQWKCTEVEKLVLIDLKILTMAWRHEKYLITKLRGEGVCHHFIYSRI